MKTGANTFPAEEIRMDFPILQQQVHGRPLVYFDNGATTQKPECVIQRIDLLYREQNSSIHRSVSHLSEKMTQSYEQARSSVARFINARSSREVVFTAGATASINLVASCFGREFIQEGDEILLTHMEHHSNIVPWQMVRDQTGAVIRVAPVTDEGELDLDGFQKLLSDRTRIVALTHVSNALGTVNPVKDLISMAHARSIPVMIDGAQGIQHGNIDVQDLDADFYVFSGHKVYGPTGIGVLYGKEAWLDKLPPWQGGGDMIERVTFEKTTFNELPFKFEAGTTHYVGAIGLAEALDYLTRTGLDEIHAYENELLRYGTGVLDAIPNLRMYGRAAAKIPIFSFLLEGIHPYDAGVVIDKFGIAVRTGTHCTMPLMDRFGITGTIRASLCFYNTHEEIDRLAEGLHMVNQMFA